jgi:hypothetical protein
MTIERVWFDLREPKLPMERVTLLVSNQDRLWIENKARELGCSACEVYRGLIKKCRTEEHIEKPKKGKKEIQ